MALQRTQKGLAKRIDQTYFHKPHPWRRARRSLVFICCLAAVLYIAFAIGTGRSESIHNPGNLMPAHASFQNNCAACHSGEGGKFSLVVTDAACLKCHDAAAHHQTQASMVMFDAHKIPVRSANCVECHVEHRGREVMVASADQYCTQCHANLGQGLGATLHPLAAGVPLHVTGFTADEHPHFGRELVKDGKMFDPTVLRFNHKKHLDDALKGEQKNCTWCHTPGSGPTGDEMGAPAAMPIKTAYFRSMQQVSFERNCAVCHVLGTIPGSNVAIPHAEMAQVRSAIVQYVTDRDAPWDDIQCDSTDQSVNTRLESTVGVGPALDGHEKQFKSDLDAVTAAADGQPISATGEIAPPRMPAAQYAEINTAIEKAIPGTSKTILTKRKKYTGPLAATTQPAAQYKISASVLRDIRHYVETKAPEADRCDLLAALARFDKGSPDPRLLQFYIAEGNGGSSCILCHDLQGNVAAIPAEWSSFSGAPLPDATPATRPTDLATVPTGIPDGPRRWFVNSEFNHDAHRSMNCVECHAAALTSSQTSEVLSPDFQWQGYNHEGTAIVSRSCFQCHHAEDSTGPGAKSNCVECHAYHDRSKERLPESSPAPATRPAVAAAGP